MRTENRTFIISGGSSGLGLAAAHGLLANKAFVSIVDRSEPPKEVVASNVKFFKTDITDVKQIQAAVDGTVAWATSTGAPLSGVINSAGVPCAARILDAHDEPHSLDLWEFVLNVNLTGSFNLTRLALKEMAKNKPEDGEDAERGVVIFVASAAAFEAPPGQTAYAASKGALRAMTLPMARDLARYGIRVVTIAPSTFESGMTVGISDRVRKGLTAVYPHRFGKGEEFSKTVNWIIECPFINGESIRLSGAGSLPAKL